MAVKGMGFVSCLVTQQANAALLPWHISVMGWGEGGQPLPLHNT